MLDSLTVPYNVTVKESHLIIIIWGWVKTLVPSEPQNSWVKMDVHSPKNGIFIGIDPYPYLK